MEYGLNFSTLEKIFWIQQKPKKKIRIQNNVE